MLTCPKKIERSEDHIYTVDGKTLPSVTQILAIADPYKYVNKILLEKAAKFGVAVHRMIELFNRNRLNMDSLNVALVPYLEAWKKFIDETGFQIIESEVMVSSSWGYAGTLDCVGYLHNRLVELDIKATATVLKLTALQLAAYQKAFEETFEKTIEQRISIQLKPCDYGLTSYANKNDFLIFINFLNVYRWLQS